MTLTAVLRRMGRNLRHVTSDGFGASLIGALRKEGYALSEFPQRSPGKVSRSTTPAETSSDVSLAYVVDQPLDATVYRVTVHMNAQSLLRLYETKDGIMKPAGSWVRKE